MELAFRDDGQPAEMLREQIRPFGMHFMLIHFDIPQLDAADYRVAVAGRVRAPMVLSLDDLKVRASLTQPVMPERAGTGRSTTAPRSIYVLRLYMAIGNHEWTGTPLWPLRSWDMFEEAPVCRIRDVMEMQRS